MIFYILKFDYAVVDKNSIYKKKNKTKKTMTQIWHTYKEYNFFLILHLEFRNRQNPTAL